jgi:hypothetical protein
MDPFAILTVITLYLMLGILTWQFWILVVIETYNSKDKDFPKLLNIPLFYLVLFWPLSIIILTAILIYKK